jgi:predicted GIY-YIG superfamily endonuclease
VRPDRRFVYILKKDAQPPSYYTGVTSDVPGRLLSHNNGQCGHTASGRPWRVDVAIELADERRATAFEHSLAYFEGTGESLVAKYLTEVSVPAQVQVAVGTIWPRPDHYHVPVIRESMDALAGQPAPIYAAFQRSVSRVGRSGWQ